MPPRITWSRAAGIAVVLLLPIKAGGCAGHTACIVESPAAYEKAGACPGSRAAMNVFASSCMGDGYSPIISVDGQGSYDGEFCCYPVTQGDGVVECGGSSGFGGVGGVGGDGGAGGAGGFGGAGGSSTTDATSSVSGTGGMSMCFHCGDELDGASTDPGQLCAAAAPFWTALETCLCGNGPCEQVCGSTTCMGQAASPQCSTCTNDPSAAGCGTQLGQCMSH